MLATLALVHGVASVLAEFVVFTVQLLMVCFDAFRFGQFVRPKHDTQSVLLLFLACSFLLAELLCLE